MDYIRLEGIGPQVSRIGLGGEQLGGHGWGTVVYADLAGVVRRALDLGVTLFDTAPIYGLGRSEELLGKELKSRRHDVVIATKCGLRWSAVPEFSKRPEGSPEWIRAELEGSLQRLGTDYVDLYQVHWPDPNTPLEDTLGVLADLQIAGKIRAIGCCNFSAEDLRQALSFCHVTVVQVPYNLIDRAAAVDIIPLCREHGVAVLAYSPLARGLLTGKYASGREFGPADNRSRHPYVTECDWRGWPAAAARLKEMAVSTGRTAADLAVSWVLNTEGVTAAIVGAKNPAQIEAICIGGGGPELRASLFDEIGKVVRGGDCAQRKGDCWLCP